MFMRVNSKGAHQLRQPLGAPNARKIDRSDEGKRCLTGRGLKGHERERHHSEWWHVLLLH